MADYPDWTDLVHIVGTDIMIAIDLQGAYIMMPIDIQAQYIDLDINIKSQTVDITIDIEAQSVGIYLKADWSALQDEDKDFRATQANVADGASVYAEYTVTTGKTLYLTHIGVLVWGYDAADREKNQICAAHISVAGTYKFEAGGNGGVVALFSKPIVGEAGQVVHMYGGNYSGHAANIVVTASGYEV